MADKQTILIQLDTDPLPSVFDRVVAVDAGATHIFSYGGVTPENVRELVHGAIFTRGPGDLKHTAIFIGGSDVAAGEKVLAEVRKHMLPAFGLQVSVLLDSNGANTTAAAAVRLASRHLDLAATQSLVLAGTGPVGQRVALLLANHGGQVRIASRQQARSASVASAIQAKNPTARVTGIATATAEELKQALADCALVVAAGAAGIQLLPRSARQECKTLRVAIDLNAVPPLGIEGVEPTDKEKERDGIICCGALGTGGTKMKIHKAAIAQLFQRSDQVLDAPEVYALG